MSILIDEACQHGYPVVECDDCAGVVYTPTTDEVRYAALFPGCPDDSPCTCGERFDRWLAAHDKEVLEKAAERVAAVGPRYNDHEGTREGILEEPDGWLIDRDSALAAVRGDGESNE
jgi:hypothetical protein